VDGTAVTDYYASLWNARWPHDPKDPESYWGYVVSMDCTEGNIYGLWNGRDYLAGKFLLDDSAATTKTVTSEETAVMRRRLIYQQALPTTENPNAYVPIAFYSDDTHYSIIKAVQMLEISTFYEIGSKFYPKDNPLARGQPWPKEVPSKAGNSGPGSIDVDALAKLVEFFSAKGYPILISLNYGTTFKGAYDDVENVGNTLLPIFRRYGLDKRKVYYDANDPSRFDRRTGYWIHVDGALGAAYMPFIEMAYQSGLITQRGPNFDFRLSFIHSLSMSGHKWIGAPWPCGIYMTKVKYQLRPPDDPEYIGAEDTTFAGSRNGFSSMVLWDYLAKNSYARQVCRALYTEKLAGYAYQELIELGKQIGQDIWVERSPLSLTIRFKAVRKELAFRYSLSGKTIIVNGKARMYNHIFIMPFGSKELIDQFIQELSRPGALPPQNEEAVYEPEARTGTTRLAYFPRHGRGFK
jgi:histidine decarboxylase